MKYILMHKTNPVLSMEIYEGAGMITSLGELYEQERLPIGIPYSDNIVNRAALNAWWTRRSIPTSRSGLLDALEMLQIHSPLLLLTECNGFSLSDQYWVCPEGSNLRWEDINFFDHPFSYDVGSILFGEAPKKPEFNLLSPDNTTDGFLKKKWIIADGKRVLIKGGSGAAQQEPYNEVIATAVMRRLSIPHVPYTLTMIDEYPYSVCEDFITKETELISAGYILQTQEKPSNVSYYQHYLNCCHATGIPDVSGALDHMLVVDYITANKDRHYNNFGAIRNADTLEWFGAAPIYDSGTSIWCNEPMAIILPISKLPSKPFISNHAEQIKLVKSFEWLDFEALYGIDEEFSDILANSVFIDDERRDALCYGLLKRVELLCDYIRVRCIR